MRGPPGKDRRRKIKIVVAHGYSFFFCYARVKKVSGVRRTRARPSQGLLSLLPLRPLRPFLLPLPRQHHLTTVSLCRSAGSRRRPGLSSGRSAGAAEVAGEGGGCAVETRKPRGRRAERRAHLAGEAPRADNDQRFQPLRHPFASSRPPGDDLQVGAGCAGVSRASREPIGSGSTAITFYRGGRVAAERPPRRRDRPPSPLQGPRMSTDRGASAVRLGNSGRRG